MLVFSLSSCEKKGPAEKAGEKVDNAIEKAGGKVEEAGDKIKELLMQPEKAKAAGEHARAFYLKNPGAVDRALKIIEEFINKK